MSDLNKEKSCKKCRKVFGKNEMITTEDGITYSCLNCNPVERDFLFGNQLDGVSNGCCDWNGHECRPSTPPSEGTWEGRLGEILRQQAQVGNITPYCWPAVAHDIKGLIEALLEHQAKRLRERMEKETCLLTGPLIQGDPETNAAMAAAFKLLSAFDKALQDNP